MNKLLNMFFGTQYGSPYLQRSIWQRLHLDPILCGGLAGLIVVGLFILYSAGSQSFSLILQQSIRLALAVVVLVIVAQIPPYKYRQWAPWIFGIAIMLLISVLIVGKIGKGAQRWISLGILRFQPSEIMKLSVPLMLAWYLHDKPLPPSKKTLFICGLLILIPALLTAKQPDLGTALIIISAGVLVLFLAGLSWRLIISTFILILCVIPIVWRFFMHDYQKNRILTFFDPEADPLGNGYHIIQSKIAIGSGGFLGKGWLNGTQSHLQFLPEHATDFIFAVCGEEFGLIGCIILITLFLIVIGRCLYISINAQDTFTRLLAGGISLTFFLSVFINIGMVIGILPVVGVPLPLISYGGTSLMILLAEFGIIMSIHTHRQLLRS